MTYFTYNQSKLTNDIDKLVKNVLFKNLRGKHFQDQLNRLYRPFMSMYYSQESELCWRNRISKLGKLSTIIGVYHDQENENLQHRI